MLDDCNNNDIEVIVYVGCHGDCEQHEACNRGLVAVATLLLDNGAMIDVPGDENETALHDAVNNCRVDCVKLLVSRGASLTLRSVTSTNASIGLYMTQ